MAISKKEQENLLERFADLSDRLFQLGVIATDSFTGEIGEYYACQLFDLKKSARVTRAVDGVSKNGIRYQVKAKMVSSSYNYSLSALETELFDFLVIIYFNKSYNPVKILRIPSRIIKDNEIRISSSNIDSFEQIDTSTIKHDLKNKRVINEFAKAYNELETSGIIRSRRIVGDIGEFYACRRLNLHISSKKNEKGIDASHSNGLTFEIKTRRVYESGRRTGEARRLNSLVGKTADYLIVVTLDRSFKCSGMWLIPMKNVKNPKSAHLGIVNSTKGTLNLIPSQISWLMTGETFQGFEKKPGSKISSHEPRQREGAGNPKQSKKANAAKNLFDTPKSIPVDRPYSNQYFVKGFWEKAMIIAIILIIIYVLNQLDK
jgi:hypothetical protein